MIGAYTVLFVCSILLFLLLFLLVSLLWTTVIGGVPYLATDQERVQRIVRLAQIRKGSKVVDLGSGDGRIVIAMAKAGAEAHGYELNIFYVLFSRWNIKKNGLQGKAFIHWCNFFHRDLSFYDVIIAYCISYSIGKLEKKVRKEIKSSARVITISYAFKTWQYTKKTDNIFLYTLD